MSSCSNAQVPSPSVWVHVASAVSVHLSVARPGPNTELPLSLRGDKYINTEYTRTLAFYTQQNSHSACGNVNVSPDPLSVKKAVKVKV